MKVKELAGGHAVLHIADAGGVKHHGGGGEAAEHFDGRGGGGAGADDLEHGGEAVLVGLAGALGLVRLHAVGLDVAGARKGLAQQRAEGAGAFLVLRRGLAPCVCPARGWAGWRAGRPRWR